jgi:hypothetical protein
VCTTPTTEIIEATEWNHQCALNSITKLATEQLAAKDKEHGVVFEWKE